MTDQSVPHRGTRLLMIAASVVIILWGLHQAQSIVVLMLVSLFLAVIGTVPVLWMERRRIPSVVAVVVVVVAMVALLLGVGVVVGASVNGFSNALPLYQTRIQDMLAALKGQLAGGGITITDDILRRYVNPAAVMDFIASLLTALSSVLSNIVLILFTALFILLEASSFPAKIRSILETPHATFPQVTKFVNDIKRYMVIKTALNLVVGTLTALWLAILGVDFPVLWGFLAFLFHYVPNIGAIVAAVPAVLLAFIQFGGGFATLTAAGYLAIGLVLGNIIEPKIMGDRLGMSTLVVFLSLIFWGNLLGLIGALLCVPLTMTLKLACEENEETRWIAVLLGPEISRFPFPGVSKKGTP